MKRLLAYLFIIFGLGLFFNISAKANWEVKYCIKKNGDDGKWPFYTSLWKSDNYNPKCPSKMKPVSKVKYNSFKKVIDKKYVPNSLVSKKDQEAITMYGGNTADQTKKNSYTKTSEKITKAECKEQIGFDGEVRSWIICKKETNQKNLENNKTIQITSKKSKNKKNIPSRFRSLSDLISIDKNINGKIITILYNPTLCNNCETNAFIFQNIEQRNDWLNNNKINNSYIYKTLKNGFDGQIAVLNVYERKNKDLFNKINMILEHKSWYSTDFYYIDKTYGINIGKLKNLLFNFKQNKTLIAKKEPSQTQKVAKKPLKQIPAGVKFCNAKLDYPGYMTKYNCFRPNTLSEFVYFNLHKISSNETVLSNNLNRLYGQFNQFNIDYDLINKIILEDQKFERYRKFIKNNNTQIAKAEQTVTPKKKVKVVKKEEFKPDNKDNEAPVIEIAEAITVNDSTYEIEGKVIDKSKKLFVLIDGETIPVRNGKFKVTRFSPVDEQLKIVAIDQWNNKSKPKLVNITIDIKGTELVEKLEQLNPSLIKSKPNKNRVALIIGIEKYEQTPDANFANLDAQYFYEYARKGFGISKANINLLVDEDASLIKSISTINKWLPSKIKKNQTELIIFFAGHGLASNDGKELYLLPQDSDPDLLSRTALSRTELFEQIIKLSPKSVTMFMDTCYSGISRDEKMLLASARPIRIVASDKDGIPDNFTIFSASRLDQISSGLKEAEHGIFSYFLMKGLEGKADLNKDKEITNGELLAYMDQNVSQKASELGRQQNPSLAGDPDKVLINYR